MSREGEGEGAGRRPPVPRACLSLGSVWLLNGTCGVLPTWLP